MEEQRETMVDIIMVGTMVGTMGVTVVVTVEEATEIGWIERNCLFKSNLTSGY